MQFDPYAAVNASQAIDDNNTIIAKQKEIGKIKEQNAADHQQYIQNLNQHQNTNAQLAKRNETLLHTANKLALENKKHKDILSKPLLQIIEEMEALQKAYDEQQALTAMWMLRQRIMKKIAFDLGKTLDISEEEILKMAIANQSNILINNENLDGIISPSNMEFFQKHKQYILNELK